MCKTPLSLPVLRVLLCISVSCLALLLAEFISQRLLCDVGVAHAVPATAPAVAHRIYRDQSMETVRFMEDALLLLSNSGVVAESSGRLSSGQGTAIVRKRHG